MYCCYGVLLAKSNYRLCDESPEAWQYGPVFPRTLNRLKAQTPQSFKRDLGAENMGFNKEIVEDIDNTLRFFGKFSANQLSMWSHTHGSPWARASNDGQDLYGQIDDASIRAYFKDKVIGSF